MKKTTERSHKKRKEIRKEVRGDITIVPVETTLRKKNIGKNIPTSLKKKNGWQIAEQLRT